MEPSFSLKDELFNEDTVSVIAKAIKTIHAFDHETFIIKCVKGFEGRELKERMGYVALCLEEILPEDFIEATQILYQALKGLKVGQMFVFGAFCDFVANNGCNDEYVDHSLEMLGEYTKSFSSEFAIRTFINHYPIKSFEKMMEWSLSEDEDQRRLASEGLRPKLPWSIKINFDYKKGIKPLYNLYHDEVRYVTRSVANHLNDIAKIDPDLVVEILKDWVTSGKQSKQEMDYIVNHSSRTLIKKGHLGALALQGYNAESQCEISDFKLVSKALTIGDYLEFNFEFKALEDAKYMVDYIVEYPMANGKRSSKVFKIKKLDLKKNEGAYVKKRHQFKQMTTKTWYQGEYKVKIQVNGRVLDSQVFSLEV